MGTQTLKLTLTGLRPLLMHNARLADPLDKAAKALKEITGKRTKTDEDHAEAAKREFLGGLYLDEETEEPIITSDCLAACFIEGAKKSKKGRAFKESMWFDIPHFPLIYDGPKSPLDLWADPRHRLRKSAKVGTSRVMRTRPRFPSWAVKPEVVFDAAQLNIEEVLRGIQDAGQYIGLLDWRPQYGRFKVEVRS